MRSATHAQRRGWLVEPARLTHPHEFRSEHERENTMFTTKRGLVAVALFGALIGLWLSPGRGVAAQPYGGCKEAYAAPHSAAADRCRDNGWTIRVRPSGHGIIVSPRHIVRYLWLPQCINEDGSGQRSACTWNVTLPYQGDGLGRALWIDWSDRVHYVKRTIPAQEM